jgi:hypothetical protein
MNGLDAVAAVICDKSSKLAPAPRGSRVSELAGFGNRLEPPPAAWLLPGDSRSEPIFQRPEGQILRLIE